MAKTKKNTSKKIRGVRDLGGGRYEIRAYWLDPKTGKEREAIETVEASSPEEAAFLRVRLRERKLSERVGLAVERPRFGEAIGAWLDGKKKTIKPSTSAQYSTAVKAWRGAFDDYWLDAVQPSDVIGMMEGWREAELDPHTINGRLRVLRTFAKEARHGAMVEAVRAIAHTVSEAEEDEDNGRGLDADELRAWFAALDKIKFRGRGGSAEIWRPLLRLLGWTGLRFGEVSALEWRDLDLDERTARVRRAVWRGQVGHPKAKASRRTIPIPEEVAEELRTMRREIQIATGVINVEGIVFRSAESSHGYVSNTGLRKNMIKVCKAAEIKLGTRPALHSLRHSVNNLLRTVTPELVRQAMIGHADEGMNATYSKVGLEEKRAAAAQVVRIVRGV